MCIKQNSITTGKELKKLINVTRIDSCMKEEIKQLNKKGIKTLACCCGHKKYPKTIIYQNRNGIYDLVSGIKILRNERFYIRDKQGLFFIPESIGIKKTTPLEEYKNIHLWVRKQWLKKPKIRFCNKCYKKGKLELGNISGKYKKELSDWEWICRKCHNKFHKEGIYANNRFKESLKESNKNNYKKNKIKILKHKKLYAKKNKNILKLHRKEFYQQNIERLRIKSKENYWKNKKNLLKINH